MRKCCLVSECMFILGEFDFGGFKRNNLFLHEDDQGAIEEEEHYIEICLESLDIRRHLILKLYFLLNENADKILSRTEEKN